MLRAALGLYLYEMHEAIHLTLRDQLDQIARLDAYATQGEWLIAPGNFIVHDCRNGDPETGRVVAEVPCQGANNDDLPFIAALVNYYRSGALQRLAELAEDGERYRAQRKGRFNVHDD
jgi:hypothetical protein